MDLFLNVFVLLMSCFLIPIRSEEENVSIVTEGGGLTATEMEVSKRMQADEIQENLLPMMFARGPPASDQFGGGDYTKKEQKALLEAHNNLRKRISAGNMKEMVWSPTLAVQAQRWSDGCYYEHPIKDVHTDYQGVGQNLYIKYLDKGGKKPPPVTHPVDEWYDEEQYYDYSSMSCSYVCGHYTQVVWAQTTEVGCGIKFCPLARSDTETYENAWMVTCNYSPAGNVRGQHPYKQGQQCSLCEGFCKKNLCSQCKSGERGCECNKRCANGGKLNPKKCTCKCPPGYNGPTCEETCRDTDKRCGANPGWPKFWCGDDRFAFVQEKCPKLCKLC